MRARRKTGSKRNVGADGNPGGAPSVCARREEGQEAAEGSLGHCDCAALAERMSAVVHRPPIASVASQELRRRVEQGGFEALSDPELVALLLGGGNVSRCHRMVVTARTLLSKFGGLRGLGSVAVGRLEREKGMGPTRAAMLEGAFELGRRWGERRLERGAVVRSSADVFRHCCHSLAHLKKEVFRVVLLDGKNRVLKDARVSEGSLTTSLVHPREVFVPVIEESAAALILVHNHPSGDPAPSKEDIEITKRLKQVGEILGVRVLDHVIVGDGCYVSLADEGLL